MKTLKSVSQEECAAFCVTHSDCFFFNHHINDTICELITSNDNKTNTTLLEERQGWNFFSTDFNATKVYFLLYYTF